MKFLKAVLCVVLSVVAVTAQARSLDEIKKQGKIVIASEGQYAPFNFFEGSRLTGFEIDVADAVAKKMGLAVEWKTLAFDALLAGLATDRWDLVIASHAITPEREKAVTFTAPHYCSGGVIVSKSASISKAKDLAGHTVAAQTGTSYLEALQKIPGINAVKNFPKDTDAQSALMSGRVDAWVTDKFVAKPAVASNPKANLKIGDFVVVERVAAAVKKGNNSLAQAYNEALKQVMADGTYAAISKKYFDEDVRCH
ncbi:MAG: amino acid ABC transporter substrate-binding protein [Gammaproteobacteria bacterium]|nr:amino acid ABC transporter substrate-binding protein [Gammaproteobacteria bacterium]